MQTYDTPAPITATLDIPAGRIQLIAADRTDTTVGVLPADPASSRDVKAAGQTTADYGNGVLHIQAPAGNRLLGNPGSVEVTVQLPAGSQVQAGAAAAARIKCSESGTITAPARSPMCRNRASACCWARSASVNRRERK
ncbi:MAG TPA: hypothetical protein VGG16_08425 [Streptosporangiaceae bacterium]